MKSRAGSLATAVVLVAAALVAASSTAAQERGPDKAAKEQKVRRLLELNGTVELSKSEDEDICKSFATLPRLPKGFEEAFRKETQPSDLVDMLVPLYQKHLDDDVLDSLVAFYSTPAGKKFALAQPAIRKDSGALASEWVMRKTEKVLTQLNADEGKSDGKKKDGPKKPIPGEGD